MPDEARQTCDLFTLPDGTLTQDQLLNGYVIRGHQIVDCDGRRDLAVRSMDREHQGVTTWLGQVRDRLRHKRK